jgi:hypothetical protein
MEGRIKAGDLKDMGRRLGDELNWREVVRLMQGSQWHEFGEGRHNRRIDPSRCRELRSPMHDTVAECQYGSATQKLAPQLQDLGGRRLMV